MEGRVPCDGGSAVVGMLKIGGLWEANPDDAALKPVAAE